MVSMRFLTPDLNLITLIGLAITMGLVQIFQQRNLGNMKNVWRLFSWFTLVVLPLVAVPELIIYWKLSPRYFLFAILIDISIWVSIVLLFRKKHSLISNNTIDGYLHLSYFFFILDLS